MYNVECALRESQKGTQGGGSRELFFFFLRKRNLKIPHVPKSIVASHRNGKKKTQKKTLQPRKSDENAKRGRDGQTMLLPVGVSKAVNKGFL